MSNEDRTCATCKHWVPEAWVRKALADPDSPDGDHLTGKCPALLEKLDIEENPATTRMCGPNGIDYIETPYDFGCTIWGARHD